jgi:hypothetical protein
VKDWKGACPTEACWQPQSPPAEFAAADLNPGEYFTLDGPNGLSSHYAAADATASVTGDYSAEIFYMGLMPQFTSMWEGVQVGGAPDTKVVTGEEWGWTKPQDREPPLLPAVKGALGQAVNAWCQQDGAKIREQSGLSSASDMALLQGYQYCGLTH